MPVRWGIVTAAKICHDFVNAFNSYPAKKDAVIAAVAARDKSKATEFAKLHNIPKVFGSYKEMAESKDIDVAYIGSLNPQHYELTKLFLENGKHVLCEKPLCMNSKQVQSLVNLARKKKLFLMEAIWSRFAPAYIALEKEIQAGKLGELQYVEVNYGLPISEIARLSKKELGGSAIMDLGIYALQFAQYIFKDEPLKCTAVGNLNDDGVDEVDTVILEYSGGRRAVLNIHAKARLWNKATVYGTAGRASIEEPFHFPESMVHVDGTVEKFPLHSSKIYYNFDNSAGLVYEALEVTRCIQQGLLESPRVPLRDSIIISKLEDSVRRQVGVVYDADGQEFP
ncbi:trans-1,2-dihydrobenzene-1,2-diol dehydrogenase-like isoform X2 [Zerene cesonia]|uniref:trans-1,2-dihydrobenzene-1,2-diol dehydrogenase-like isoform X2 n=1 Tax=Zerene cesonia TaxID=33412 RepID=UPI0018E519C1|nr:trans-1,2-dihydrobenzene-1,2-diol dehydrogenase-like isoform X2 [Zerene cesonia]